MVKSKMRKKIILLMGLIYVFVFTSCVTLLTPASATSSGPRTLVIDNSTVNAEEVGGFTSWICTDSIDGTKILLEVGFFGDPMYDGLGFILFDGGYSGEFTYYERAGIEHRWDWGSKENKYAFVIKPDGTGLYYKFMGEKTAKASSVYKCYQRKTSKKNTDNN